MALEAVEVDLALAEDGGARRACRRRARRSSPPLLKLGEVADQGSSPSVMAEGDAGPEALLVELGEVAGQSRGGAPGRVLSARRGGGQGPRATAPWPRPSSEPRVMGRSEKAKEPEALRRAVAREKRAAGARRPRGPRTGAGRDAAALPWTLPRSPDAAGTAAAQASGRARNATVVVPKSRHAGTR